MLNLDPNFQDIIELSKKLSDEEQVTIILFIIKATPKLVETPEFMNWVKVMDKTSQAFKGIKI